MANGPRVFYVKVLYPEPGMVGMNDDPGEHKISARGPKDASVTFIRTYWPKAIWYDDRVVRLGIRERGSDKVRIFAISSVITAEETKAI